MSDQPPTSPPPQYVVVQAPASRGNGFAIASLILSVVAIMIGIIPFFIGLILSFVPCVLGISFGIAGLVRASGLPDKRGFGPALAGLIVGGVTFLLYFTGYGILW